MKVEIFTLCSNATIDSNSKKLSIIDIFDSIYAENVPLTYEPCFLAMRLRFDRIEKGSKNLRINIVDEDGKHILAPHKMKIEIMPDIDLPFHYKSYYSQLPLLTFHKFGEYRFDLLIENNPEASTSLYVYQKKLTTFSSINSYTFMI